MTREIPREQWTDYLESVSAEFQGHPVTIRIENPEVGDEVLVDNLPLVAIEPDFKERSRSVIVITAKPLGPGAEGIRHFINRPHAIWAQQDEEGRPQVIDFESEEEGKTLLKIA